LVGLFLVLLKTPTASSPRLLPVLAAVWFASFVLAYIAQVRGSVDASWHASVSACITQVHRILIVNTSPTLVIAQGLKGIKSIHKRGCR
jgi:hypothetical protein